MRQQDRVIIWSAYFDLAKTIAEGRRVPKSLAVPSPKIAEIKDAAEKLHLECDLVVDVAYPKTPWAKTGMLLVKKKRPKAQTISEIAKQLLKTRSSATLAKTK
jgi:signal recognition particle subunit SRP19